MMRAVVAAAAVGVAMAGTGSAADCAVGRSFTGTPTIELADDASREFNSELSECLSGVAPFILPFDDAAGSDDPTPPTSIEIGDGIPIAYPGASPCTLGAAEALGAPVDGPVSGIALLCPEPGSGIAFNFFEAGGTRAFSFFAYDATNQINVVCGYEGGETVYNVFSDDVLASEVNAGGTSFFGFRRGADEPACLDVAVLNGGNRPDDWGIDNIVFLEPGVAPSCGACENGGVDEDCDGECECPGDWNGPTCTECGTSCLNGGSPADTCDGTCSCPGMWDGDVCDVCPVACENGGADEDCDGKCACVGMWEGDLCNVCPDGSEIVAGDCVEECPGDLARDDTGGCACPDGLEAVGEDSCAEPCAGDLVRDDAGGCACPEGLEAVGEDSCAEPCVGARVRNDAGECECPEGSSDFGGGDTCIELPDGIVAGECTASVEGDATATSASHSSGGNCAGIVWTSCSA